MKVSWVLSFLFAGVILASAQPLRVEFRQPHVAAFDIQKDQLKGATGSKWIKATATGGNYEIELSDRVALQINDADQLKTVLQGSSLKIDRTISPTLFILQATDALSAAQEAHRISQRPEVIACYPVASYPAEINAPFAEFPKDIFFHRFLFAGGTNRIYGQWNLENRAYIGEQIGADIAIRGAWPYSRGEGVTVAIADCGIQMIHPELSRNSAGAPHFNFVDYTTNAIPYGTNGFWAHGTMVAGLIAAEANNNRGLAGIAHESKIASWVIIRTNGPLVSEEKLMDMYQHASNIVHIQNHSWVKGVGAGMMPMGTLESLGFSNSIVHGRNGLGTIQVRAAGNSRTSGRSPDDRGETANRFAITVAATGHYGRVASYSESGASVLVATPSGDINFGSPNLFTTDLLTNSGMDQLLYFGGGDLNDYAHDFFGFSGTSGAAPQISGIAALLLKVNPAFSYRDVQQILVNSAKHWDLADHDVKTNGANFLISHNQGYGIPNAGEAVRIALNWQPRPGLEEHRFLATNETVIPDAGLRLLVFGENLPAPLASIVAEPSQRGPHADVATATIPLVDVGTASSPIAQNLTGKGAVSLRDAFGFSQKITNSASAGAAFAVICNNTSNPIVAIGGTDFNTIPAVCIPKNEGELLRTYMTTNTATGQIALNSAIYNFSVPQTLRCEHVGVRVNSNHPQRGDLRITLTSPDGTRSLLQILGLDTQPIPESWTYISTHHFYENSTGTWTVAITDEFQGGAGAVQEVELFVWGTPLVDSDHDGIEDAWETSLFGSLDPSITSDADADGYSDLRESILGTDPHLPNSPLAIDLTRYNDDYFRAGWPSSLQFNYEVWGGTNLNSLNLITTIPGRFPETDWVHSDTNGSHFIRVEQKPK